MKTFTPNYRAIDLGHIAQVRLMRREGRYTVDCERIIKRTQRHLLALRKARNV